MIADRTCAGARLICRMARHSELGSRERASAGCRLRRRRGAHRNRAMRPRRLRNLRRGRARRFMLTALSVQGRVTWAVRICRALHHLRQKPGRPNQAGVAIATLAVVLLRRGEWSRIRSGHGSRADSVSDSDRIELASRSRDLLISLTS